MFDFDTLSEAINGLKAKGYTRDFNLLEDEIHCDELGCGFKAKEFKVDYIFRFEGDSNPSDNSILFAIETASGEKGILLDAYGTYSSEVSPELLEALKIR